MLWGSTFFATCMVGKGQLYIMLCKMFLQPLWKTQNFVFHKSKPTSFDPLPLNLCTLIQHCVTNWWCPHIVKCYHHRVPSNWFGFTGYYFSTDWDDNYDSNKGWSLLRSIPNGHVFLSSCRGFWMSSLTCKWVSSSLCQHDMAFGSLPF
jgi:hypothetical protein